MCFQAGTFVALWLSKKAPICVHVYSAGAPLDADRAGMKIDESKYNAVAEYVDATMATFGGKLTRSYPSGATLSVIRHVYRPHAQNPSNGLRRNLVSSGRA